MSAAEDARRRSTRLHPHTHASEAGEAVTRHRNTRLHPQIHASDDGDGVARRRSPRLHPQVQASEEGQGLALRRSARLRPHAHANEEASGVTRRSRRLRRGSSSSAALSSPLEGDDLLWEILLRLPPEPSSLPRASAVCKRWRCAVTDPRFHRRFCQHHRKPPLLGFFEPSADGIVFTPVMDPPDRIPPQRFDLRLHGNDSGHGRLLGCRHGRLLIMSWQQEHLIVIAPITGEKLQLTVPSKFKPDCYLAGEVLCAAADHNHVHGNCHSNPFKVVLLSAGSDYHGPQPAFACVYSSETGIWSDLISTPTPCQLHCIDSPGSLIGNSLYWLCGDYMIEFDLDGQSLALIETPPILNGVRHQYEIIQVVDGVVGLAIFSKHYHNIQMLRRKLTCQGVTDWVLWKTVEMNDIHGIPPQIEGERSCWILGLRYDEDTCDMFIYVDHSIYMVQLKSMQSRKLCESNYHMRQHYFKSFYTPAIARGCDGAEMLQETYDDCLVWCANVPKQFNR